MEKLSQHAKEVLLSRHGKLRPRDNGYMMPTRQGLTYFAVSEVEQYAAAVGVKR
tara:strand:- start:149 stop:310 length:162 start_codon:yes stop_codon:yes gene_type:complete